MANESVDLQKIAASFFTPIAECVEFEGGEGLEALVLEVANKAVAHVQVKCDRRGKALNNLLEAIEVSTKITHGAALAIVGEALADPEEPEDG